MLNNAGKETTKENRSVLIPLADLTSLKTLPILKTRMTLIIVGDIFVKENAFSISQTEV